MQETKWLRKVNNVQQMKMNVTFIKWLKSKEGEYGRKAKYKKQKVKKVNMGEKKKEKS